MRRPFGLSLFSSKYSMNPSTHGTHTPKHTHTHTHTHTNAHTHPHTQTHTRRTHTSTHTHTSRRTRTIRTYHTEHSRIQASFSLSECHFVCSACQNIHAKLLMFPLSRSDRARLHQEGTHLVDNSSFVFFAPSCRMIAQPMREKWVLISVEVVCNV